MAKVSWKTLGELTAAACKFVGYSIDVLLMFTESEVPVRICYSDAIKAITNSTMWSDDKSKAIALVKQCASEDYYKAVITVVENSSIWSTDKVKMIQNLG